MIEELRLENFRNYEKQSFEFAPLTVLTGNNGIGKTTVLEAISMLSLTTSWKTDKDTEVVKWGTPFTRVLSGDKELVVQNHPYMKRLRIDGVSKRATQVIGLFPTILFQPDDLFLLYGAPTIRRNYIDRVISQTSSQYTQAVIQLGKVLKQRNRLLKNIQEGLAGESELGFWDMQLAEVQEIIQKHRQEFLAYVGVQMPTLFQEMVPSDLAVTMIYHMSPAPHHGTVDFLTHLQHSRMKEIASGNSLYGPHREDFEVKWGEHPAQEGMSRGQSRSLLVAFKIAELHYLSEKNSQKPVLLLDDIFSELDLERRERLVQVFGDYQVIMTTTELGTVENLLKDDTKVIAL